LATQESFIVGANEYIDALFGFDVQLNENNQDFDYSLDENFKQSALFGEITYAVNDRLELTGGLRWFDNENTSTSFLGLPFFIGLFPEVEETVEGDEDDVLYKANLTYRLTNDSMIYGTFSQGFRRGGVNGVPQEGFYAEDPAFRSYDADFVDNYELGFKGITDSFRYNISLFYVDWDNPQLNTATPTWGFFMVGSEPDGHSNKASTSGIEIELDGSFTSNWNYSIGYAYADAKLEADFINQAGTLVAVDGTRLPGAPKNSINFSTDYTTSISDTYVIFRADGFYQSDARNGLAVGDRLDQTLPSYAIFNASVTALFDDIDVTLWIKNIANEEGVSAIFSEEYMGTAPGAGYFGNGSKVQIALPRTLGLTVNYHF
jgi:outer membrane receptor protein involved in Fe transport